MDPTNPLARSLSKANGGIAGLLALLSSADAVAARQAAWALGNIAAYPQPGCYFKFTRAGLAAAGSVVANSGAAAHGVLSASLPAVAAAMQEHNAASKIYSNLWVHLAVNSKA